MPTSHLESTIEPSRGRERARIFRVPALTIAYHPDPSRVGELARLLEVLEGRETGISRLAPEFAHPFAAERAPLGPGGGRPLRDARLSRTPIGVTRTPDGGVTIRPGGTPCRVDGRALDRVVALSADALERGVTLELADRVVLVLHTLGLPAPRQPRLGMVGESEAMERLRAEIQRVARLPVPVLVRGESGVGKELVARAIAEARAPADGGRAERPFVAVNLAAIPPSLAASELFGHAPGAFTGADARHEGHFARADGGTLFLDEVAAAPLEVQAALLRVLETHELQPLGSSRAARVDVRVVSATDGDLELAVREGAFRDALYHRLAGYQLGVPPLRERRDDVARLLFAFLRDGFAAAGDPEWLDRLDAPDSWLPAALVARLVRYRWPGNVRELANFARRLVVAAAGGAPAEHAIPAELLRDDAAVAAPEPAAIPPPAAALDEETLVAALRAHRFRVGATARTLGVSRTTLYARMDASARIRKAKDVPEDELRRAFEALEGDPERMAERLEVSSRGILLRLKDLGLA